MMRRLVIEVDVMAADDALPSALDVANGILDNLSREWFEPDEGDDLWIGRGFAARWEAES